MGKSCLYAWLHISSPKFLNTFRFILAMGRGNPTLNLERKFYFVQYRFNIKIFFEAQI
jgi:hypothetical protein